MRKITKSDFDRMFRDRVMPSIWAHECRFNPQWTPQSIDRGIRSFEYDAALDQHIKAGLLTDRDYARPRWLWTLRPSWIPSSRRGGQ